MRTLAVTVVCLVALAGCSSGGDEKAEGDAPEPTETTETNGPDAPTQPAAEVCEEVTLGIDAFNYGDLEGTVEHFEKALPLAEADAEAHPSEATEAMLEAVRYYADLPPEEYPAANQSSPEFQRHKETTLTQCDYQGPPPIEPSGPDTASSGVPA